MEEERKAFLEKLCEYMRGHQWRMQLHYICILIALEIVLAFSWLGFIHVQPLSLTTLHIPVLLAALFLGKWPGALLGGVFGLLSMWKASDFGVSSTDMFFSPFLSGDPVGSLVTALGVRMLFGFLAGCVYQRVKRMQHRVLLVGMATYFLTCLHSMMVYGMLGVFFPAAGVDLYTGGDRLLSLLGVMMAGNSVIWVLLAYYWCHFTEAGRKLLVILEQNDHAAFYEENVKKLVLFLSILLCVSAAIAAYFIDGVEQILAVQGYEASAAVQGAVWSKGIQFILAIAAVAFIVFVIFLYFYTMLVRVTQKSRMDALTKLYHRESVAQQVNVLLDSNVHQNCGSFIMLDVDRFKAVNDVFGHPVGDKILCAVADSLRHAVRANDIIGRLGGDEFCVFLPGRMSHEGLEQVVQRIEKGIRQIELPDGKTVTCSIGIASYLQQASFAEFYMQADRALYLAKSHGRNCHSFFTEAN